MDGSRQRMQEIMDTVRELPRGSIGTKRVSGHTYYYHRFQEDGHRKEKYIPAEEVDSMRSQIELRKELEAELRSLRDSTDGNVWHPSPSALGLRCNVLTGEALRSFAEGVVGLKRRRACAELEGYVHGPRSDKVLVLYGLRRTGKTTMIRQVIAAMSREDLRRCAFIHASHGTSLAAINHDLAILRDHGFRFVFVDEATQIEDFVDGAALFADVFAAGGMRVVLSGTDSLGFVFAQDEQLYDRCEMLHTTFIPYAEFEDVLGIRGIDDYIRFGGTMSMGGVRYDEESTFSTKLSCDEYVDSAIARNIQHALRLYQHGGHLRALQELYENDELTGAINRIVEDVNHRFVVETLTRRFRSSDLAISARNLRSDREAPTDVLDRIDEDALNSRLAVLLEIREREEQITQVRDDHAREIREYLDMLDLTVDIEIADIDSLELQRTRTALSQPGLRYAQADALAESLMQDPTFADLPLAERMRILGRVRSEIMGRMLEDIVLLETSKALPRCRVFKLQFAVGEFDMVVFDPSSASCRIFEIKHSDRRAPAQVRHLVDEGKLERTDFRFGRIASRTVLYRGEPCSVDGIEYENVEEYLRDLWR